MYLVVRPMFSFRPASFELQLGVIVKGCEYVSLPFNVLECLSTVLTFVDS
jgi:hypothetical protein